MIFHINLKIVKCLFPFFPPTVLIYYTTMTFFVTLHFFGYFILKNEKLI